jgi:hypothetical protein
MHSPDITVADATNQPIISTLGRSGDEALTHISERYRNRAATREVADAYERRPRVTQEREEAEASLSERERDETKAKNARPQR